MHTHLSHTPKSEAGGLPCDLLSCFVVIVCYIKRAEWHFSRIKGVRGFYFVLYAVGASSQLKVNVSCRVLVWKQELLCKPK